MTFKWFKYDNALMKTAYALRNEVFTDEQGFPAEIDIDEMDETAYHVVGFDGQMPVCTARIYLEHEGVYHAGRIAVKKIMRGTGLGKRMINELLNKAKALGANRVELGAQYDKAGFYEACGFARCGEKYMDADYPHIPMGIDL
ncbi:MAG: GNAT family N-acetyltransferase [Clostridia bacterium]|jgi:ElaA protein|nr:GNAT family N-acetyltransferase [Clostridia bacterium]NLS84794.1 GNAT family N-acetyltransferase [Oscillospiraceae bacterium]